MDDVQLVSDKILQLKGMVLRVLKVENNGVAPANRLTQGQNEKS